MKIGFFGAGGTGKSTTAMALSELLKISFCPSTTRGVFAKYGKTQKDFPSLTPGLKKTIQLDNFTNKEQYDNANTHGVFDRTLLDHLMYMLLYCNDMLTDTEFNDLLDRVYVNLYGYDKLIFFPLYLWKSSVDDGFREVGIAHRYTQDFLIKGLLQKIKIAEPKLKYTTMVIGSIEERVQYLNSIITQFA